MLSRIAPPIHREKLSERLIGSREFRVAIMTKTGA